MTDDRKSRLFLAGAMFALASGGFVMLATPSPAFAQRGSTLDSREYGDDRDSTATMQEGEEEQPQRRSQQLDPANAQRLLKIYELMQADQYQAALAELNKLIAERGESMKPYDKATTYELRGSVKYNLDDYRGALRDFETALGTNALDPARNNQLRYFIAQLYFQLEDYAAAIRGLNEWIRAAQAAGQTVDPNAYYLLAAAYIKRQPADYRAAKDPAERAVAGAPTPKKNYYDLLNLVYSETNDGAKRAALLEKMINLWPGDRAYWTQLSALYASLNRDGEAFSVLEVAYRAGLITKEGDILTLVQYYSFYDNPYRGAKLLEREMATGTVAETVKNLTLLSQLWSQAREHKRAIPVLEKASRLSDKGELAYRLGQVLLADEQYAKSEAALRAALAKGGMTAVQTGDCHLLLGTAIFAQAGPGDRAIRSRAREAFVRATNYPNVSVQARQWVGYIDEVNRVEELQDTLECQQREEARIADVERLKQGAQVCRLQGRNDCDQIIAKLREIENAKEDCSTPRSGSAPGGGAEVSPAPPGSALNEPDAPATPDATPPPAERPKLEAEKPKPE
ncbi:MAG: hypothetical protein HXY23_04685 [Parvularculaceae bacterium]|nr:hypothetical protein [Parvularculaceae bacterium]